MTTSTNKVVFGNGAIVKVPAGSEMIIPNPGWDGDVPESQFNLRISLQEDVVVETLGMETMYEGLIIERID